MNKELKLLFYYNLLAEDLQEDPETLYKPFLVLLFVFIHIILIKNELNPIYIMIFEKISYIFVYHANFC